MLQFAAALMLSICNSGLLLTLWRLSCCSPELPVLVLRWPHVACQDGIGGQASQGLQDVHKSCQRGLAYCQCHAKQSEWCRAQATRDK